MNLRADRSHPADEAGVLYFFCGRAGAGKSTLARRMSVHRKAILICEDQWLARLFDGASSLEAYVERRGRLRKLLEEHVPSMLRTGHSVVFDFGGNSVRDRAWVRSVFELAGAMHELHYIVAAESLCRQRIRERNRTKPDGIYWGYVSDGLFDAVNKYFQPPTAEEKFNVVEHQAQL